jgi:hypothetical protein
MAGWVEMKIRNPKTEARKKSEIRKAPGRTDALRASGFGFVSGFGLRISDFGVGVQAQEQRRAPYRGHAAINPEVRAFATM